MITYLELKKKPQGFLELNEQDIIFVRAMNAPSTGEEDVPVGWVCGP